MGVKVGVIVSLPDLIDLIIDLWEEDKYKCYVTILARNILDSIENLRELELKILEYFVDGRAHTIMSNDFPKEYKTLTEVFGAALFVDYGDEE